MRILLDARRDGVVVPARFRGAPQLILEIGLNMNPPIPDLDTEGDGVRCTLSFAKQPFHCTLPWSSIWALIGKRDGRGYQWVEDMPPELVAVPQAPPPPRMPPVLRAVPAEPPPEPAAEPAAPPDQVAAARRDEAEEAPPAPEPPKASEEVIEELPPGKKKRQLPSYLRVIK